MTKPNYLTLKESMDALRKGTTTSVELTKACLAEIERTDTAVKAYLRTFADEALKESEQCDKEIKADEKVFEKKPLIGVPYSCKDNYCTKDLETTAGSNILKGFIPPYESTVTQKLKDVGAILLGKTNLDAFAHGASTDASDFHTTRNPWDTARVPGGSSGGSAASVASHTSIFSIGSDTGGSIRCPASWCGVTGLKPTYGRISRYGLIAMASSTDCPGPLTKTVEDSAILLKILAGHDVKDATSSSTEVLEYSQKDPIDYSNLRIGVPSSYFDLDFETLEIQHRILEFIEIYRQRGAQIIDVELLHPKYSVAVYTVLQRSEVSSNLARFDGIRFGHGRDSFGAETRRRMMLGAYTLSAGYYDEYYTKAQKVRTIIVEGFKKAFEKVDIIVGPTMPNLPVEVGVANSSPIFGEMTDMMQIPGSMAGLPVVTFPCGFANGFPVGVQVIGNHFQEKNILNLGMLYQEETVFHKEIPTVLKNTLERDSDA